MNKYLLTILITLTVSQIVSANNHFSGRNNSSFVCATVFQGKYYSGQSMVISNMEQIQDLSDLTMTSDYYGRRTASWDNKISSIQVASGCSLMGFQYQNFGRDYRSGSQIGWKLNFSAQSQYYGQFDSLRSGVNNKISSLVCKCR